MNENLSPDRWAAARDILLGENREKVSLYSAAKAAGVTVKEFDHWIARSRRRDPTDDPWIYEIAEVVDESPVAQAGVLEDVLWDQAINGVPEPVYQGGEKVGDKVKFDHTMMMKMLKVRDPRYVDKQENLNVNVNADIDLRVLEQKWVTMIRMKEIEDQREVDDRGSVIIDQRLAGVDTGLTFDAAEMAAERVRAIDEIGDAPDLSEFEDW